MTFIVAGDLVEVWSGDTLITKTTVAELNRAVMNLMLGRTVVTL